MLLSTRLQSSKTPAFTYSFVYFFAFVFAIKSDGLTPDFIIAQYESVQAGSVASPRLLERSLSAPASLWPAR